MGRVRKWLVCLCMTMSLLVGMAVVPIAAEETTEYCVITINGNGGQRSDGNEVYVCEGIKIGEPYNIRGWFKKEKAVERSLVLVDGAEFSSDEEDPMCVTFYGNATVKIEWLETGVDVAAVFYSYDWNKNTRNMYRIVDTSAEFEVPELPESTLEGTENLYWRCVSGSGVDVLPGEHVTLTENAAYVPYITDLEAGLLLCSGDERFSTGKRFLTFPKGEEPQYDAWSAGRKILLGWNTEKSGYGDFYDMVAFMPTIDTGWLTLYAIWQGDGEITVELDNTENGIEKPRMFAAKPGEKIFLPELQRDGYRFLGWQTNVGDIYKNVYTIPVDTEYYCSLTAVWEQLLYQPATVICDAASMKICIPAAQTIPETVKRIVLSAYERGRMVCSVTGTLQTDGASQRIVCEVPESLAGESDTWKVFALDDAWSPVLKAEILTFQS